MNCKSIFGSSGRKAYRFFLGASLLIMLFNLAVHVDLCSLSKYNKVEQELSSCDELEADIPVAYEIFGQDETFIHDISFELFFCWVFDQRSIFDLEHYRLNSQVPDIQIPPPRYSRA